MTRFQFATLLSLLVLAPAHTQTLDDLSFGTEETLDIATWNIEFFPKSGNTTVDLVQQIIENLEIDLWALQEIDEPFTMSQMINSIPGYNSHTESLFYGGLVYVFNTNTIEVIDNYEIFSDSQYWRAFPRTPQVMEFNHLGEEYVIINNHLKCCGDGFWDQEDPWDEENRRYDAMNLLKQYTEAFFPEKKVIILGDLNDILTDSPNNNIFQLLLQDQDYLAADMEIAEGSNTEWSFPSWPSHLDHIFITNELFDAFNSENTLVQTIKVDQFMSGGFNEYDSKITDHRPVAMRLDAAGALSTSEIATQQLKLLLYPNPATEYVNILAPNGQVGNAVEILNAFGTVVAQEPIEMNSDTIQIETSSLSDGVYFVRLKYDDNIVGVERLVLLK